MMASPSEYQTMMYEFFFNGEVPERDDDDEDGKPARKSKPKPKPKKPPKQALKDFEALMAAQQDPERVARRQAALAARAERLAAEQAAAAD